MISVLSHLTLSLLILYPALVSGAIEVDNSTPLPGMLEPANDDGLPPPMYVAQEEPSSPAYAALQRKSSGNLRAARLTKAVSPVETLHSASIAALEGRSVEDALAHYFGVRADELRERCDLAEQGKSGRPLVAEHLPTLKDTYIQVMQSLCGTLGNKPLQMSDTYHLMVNTALLRGDAASRQLGILEARSSVQGFTVKDRVDHMEAL
ncbi:MAG: hypothetical protein DHS80DRAFT_24797, partial [Piptocephalis tieghemiana]